MRTDYRIGVVIPALDEEQAIGRVVNDIPDWVSQIVVVDNGSRDNTKQVARKAGAIVVEEPETGYGAACLKGIATLDACDVVVFLDGDYSDFPGEMNLLVDPIVGGEADLVIGSRVRGDLKRGALTPQQIFGNWLACRLIKVFWSQTYSDLGPFRAIRADALASLDMSDRNYGWTVEMQIKAAERRLRAREVAVSYRPRIGVSKVSGTIKGTVLAGYTILRVIGQSAWRRVCGTSLLPSNASPASRSVVSGTGAKD